MSYSQASLSPVDEGDQDDLTLPEHSQDEPTLGSPDSAAGLQRILEVDVSNALEYVFDRV